MTLVPRRTGTPLRVKPRRRPPSAAVSGRAPHMRNDLTGSDFVSDNKLAVEDPGLGEHTPHVRYQTRQASGEPSCRDAEPLEMAAPSQSPHAVSTTKCVVSDAMKFGPRPMVQGAKCTGALASAAFASVRRSESWAEVLAATTENHARIRNLGRSKQALASASEFVDACRSYAGE